MINSNTYSQTKAWKQEQSHVGGDCYHTTSLNCKTDFFLVFIIGAMAIAPYGFLLNLKHYNLTYLSQKLFFNVKIVKNKKNSI